jgi:hypothetical protein
MVRLYKKHLQLQKISKKWVEFIIKKKFIEGNKNNR